MTDTLKRTHTCGELGINATGNTVNLTGWVQRRRDHGGLIFVDLRDRSGLVQVVFSPGEYQAAFELAEGVRNEYVLALQGKVEARPEGTRNPNLATGDIEVYATRLQVLNQAKNPPFYITDGVDVDENVRLKYRYLDLRRPEMQQTLIMRHKVTMIMREFLDQRGFLEIETPMLTKSSPEGARDYLVPSRVHPGEFYALPQSPQIFKQLLMVAGMEKYFQIVRCFRDEDLRADRQPEFTQLDLEMSFAEPQDIQSMMEEMMVRIFRETKGIEVALPLQQLTYREAMERYGSDKPDTRFDLELVDISDIVADSDFKVFADVVHKGGQVKGINAKGSADMPRRQIDELTKYAAIYGAKGLAYIVLSAEGVKSPIAKFLSEAKLAEVIQRLQGETGDILFFVADKPQVVADALGHLRGELARRLDLIDSDVYKFVWVTEFPLLEFDEEEKRWVAKHHPFTAPMDEDLPLLATDPANIRAKAYDLVLNGYEIGGGSIRIHRREVQEKMFALLGLPQAESEDKFGYLLEAFEYGTPPHGGIAFGLDRIMMLLSRRDNIRDVIAFPKTQSASDVMSNAPSPVSEKQLKELSVRINILKK
ncbi:MAG: aspartate--tRNA ligase [Peptococcaceae bacterium]|nr:aspartate--tRNA ligase [Peptococcaceae bacterium]